MRSQPDRGSPQGAVVMELLGRGAHANPRQGCNVLEYASVLAGERWDSRPQSVHPALAYVADIVNDRMSDARRRLLSPIAPWLLGTRTEDPRTWPAITAVCAAAAHALASEPDAARLQADLHTARDWLAQASRPVGGRHDTPPAGREKRRWARHVISSALGMVAASADSCDADTWLCHALVACVNQCRRLAGEPAVDPRLPLADCPRHLAVEPYFLRSPGCDWIETGYREVRDLPAAPAVQSVRGEPESATGTP